MMSEKKKSHTFTVKQVTGDDRKTLSFRGLPGIIGVSLIKRSYQKEDRKAKVRQYVS